MMLLGMALVIGAMMTADLSDLRDPTVSPDGSTVVFCFRGDLWEVSSEGGTMRCMVPGPSLETSPGFSPDGRYVAFTSNRSGGGDVYVMDGDGGISRRLTYRAGSDVVLCWNATSDSIYFRSSREGGESWIFSVPVTGGTPRPVEKVTVNNACLHPGGMIVERGFTEWWRKHYEGSSASRLWVGDGAAWELLDDSDLDTRWPMYSRETGDVLFVREDSLGHAAIWSIGADGKAVRRTFLENGDITFPSISEDGRTVVFEYTGGLWRMEIPSYRVCRIPVNCGTDVSFPLEYGEDVGFTTDCFDVDSSGAQIAVVGSGNIFAGVLGDEGIEDLVRVYAGSYRAGDPAWNPAGDGLVFTLEHDGVVELAFCESASGDTLSARKTAPALRILPVRSRVACEPVWSPDGNRLSYLDADAMLHVFDMNTGEDITVCETPDIIHHSWSPDGRWIAFSVPVLAHREDVFVVASRGGEPVNVSRHPNDDFQPLWTADGRRLLFASRTDDGEYSIKQVWFSRSDWDLEDDEREKVIDEPVSRVEIDWNGIARRTETLCTVEGYYDFYGASPDGKTIAFPAWDNQGRMDLWTVDWKGESLERLTFGGESPENILVRNDGEIFFLSSAGSIRNSRSSGDGFGTLTWRMPVWVSIPGLQAQKFDEAWRLLRDGFYDRSMHHVDWDSVRTLYRERAVASVINEDFNDVVRRMLGELSASHLGIYGPWKFDDSPSSGELGVIPDHDREGPGIMVDSVIPFSPVDREKSRLLPGDVILAVQDMEVGPDRNLYRALLQRKHRETRLRVMRNSSLLEVDVEPVSVQEIRKLLYDEWVERNRRIVAHLSGDRVGYLHIPSMSDRSVDEFLVDLFAEGMGRDGMVIDIRDNGGGSTHDEIISRLSRPRYMFSTDRFGRMTFEPLGVWDKPLVLLINERCYSDAEIFPAAWKELEIGPVVGEKTFGAVIGTSNVTLVDGTRFRIPSMGWYTLEGHNLENTGVEPDIRVVELPADAGLGVDRQLEKAVDVIMNIITGED